MSTTLFQSSNQSGEDNAVSIHIHLALVSRFWPLEYSAALCVNVNSSWKNSLFAFVRRSACYLDGSGGFPFSTGGGGRPCGSLSASTIAFNSAPSSRFISDVAEWGSVIPTTPFWTVFIFNWRSESRNLPVVFWFVFLHRPQLCKWGLAWAAAVGTAVPLGLLTRQMHFQSSYCTDIDPSSLVMNCNSYSITPRHLIGSG